MLRIFKNNVGQDLIEYALLAGFLAVTAGALMPAVSNTISTVVSQVRSTLAVAAQDNPGLSAVRYPTGS